MEAFLLYIFRSTICLTLFLIFFKVLLCRDTFFRWNRFILLGGLLFCMVCPLIEFKGEPSPFRQHLNELEKVVTGYTVNEEIIFPVEWEQMGSTKNIAERKSGFSGVAWIYMGGMGMCFFFWLFAYKKMFSIIRSGRCIYSEKSRLIIVSGEICPFSWKNYIVLSEKDYEKNSLEILTHERMHIRKKHTWDLCLMQFLLVFHWFNPAVWLLKRELQDIHEYEADEGVINQGIDATKYQLLLVKKAVGSRVESIANSFNHSKLKNRITMMLKEKSNRWARFKVLFFLPLAVLITQAFARPEVAASFERIAPSDKVNQIPDKPEKWTEDFFRKEWKEYMGEDEGVKINFDRTASVFVNSKNQILFDRKEVINEEELAGLLQAKLKDLHARFSPVCLILQRDKGTSEEVWQNILNTVGEVCSKFTEEVRQNLPEAGRDKKDKKYPVLVAIARMKDVFQKKDNGSGKYPPVLNGTYSSDKESGKKQSPPPPVLKDSTALRSMMGKEK